MFSFEKVEELSAASETFPSQPDDVTGSRGHSLVPTANKSRQLILLKQLSQSQLYSVLALEWCNFCNHVYSTVVLYARIFGRSCDLHSLGSRFVTFV